MRPRAKKWLVAAGVLALVSVIPRPVVIAPQWRVEVVDASGRPVRGAEVIETWIHYSLQKNESWESRATDDGGIAEFPVRKRTVSVLWEVAGACITVLDTGADSGFGRDASVSVRGVEGVYRGASVTPREARRVDGRLESRIVVQQ